MPHRITQLKLTDFRGATQPVAVQFDPAKNLVVIFGENGNGKSTLVDAIDAIGNATFGSLVREGIATPQKHAPSLNRTAKTMEVELTTKAGHIWKAKAGRRNQLEVTPATADGVLPGIEVLRKRDLLKFIDTTAANRYKAVQRFIEVAQVDQAEAALRADMNAVEKQYDNAGAARAQAAKSLQLIWEQERQAHETETSPEEWATQRIAENLTALSVQRSQLAQVLLAIQGLTTATASWQVASGTHDEYARQLQEAEAALASQQGSEESRRSDLIGLLNAAHSYLAPPAALTACPLCASEVQADTLRQQIERQLTQLQAASKLLQQVNSAKTRSLQAADECTRCNQRLLSQLKSVVAQLAASQSAALRGLRTDWTQVEAELQAATATDATSHRAAGLSAELASIAAGLQAEHDALQVRLNLHDNIKGQAELLQRSTEEVTDLATILKRLQDTYKVVVNTRREFVQTILDEIIEEVNRLYGLIHPGEKIGLHRFEMDPEKRASLEQQARFEGVAGVVPQAYFSESHLDTFGFCLWLALAKRLNPKQIVLVLDDVFTSVDAQHFRRISDLLADEAPFFQQIIIATHNRLWYDYYKNSGRSVQLIKLEKWSFGRGLRPHEDRIVLAELAAALEADIFDEQAVASKAGILLENVLDNLAMHYGCSIKLKPGHAYTLGDLLDSTKTLLRKASIRRVRRDDKGLPVTPEKPETWAKIELGPHFDRLSVLRSIRNEVGAHFNLAGADWAEADVREFGQAAYALAEALTCQKCGHMPKKMRSDHRGCRCEKHQTQLYPLTLS